MVGGAVRDELLGLAVHERDWVVVGSTAQQMLDLGFQAVGKDFPVFLHPKTHEEYALARTERKTGSGYKGFQVYADPSVTLEQDLQRRDLTINAIAQDNAGKLIDPFHGQRDLQAKVLRHVSPAFAEDPLRILRAARFAAKLPDFSLDAQTLIFMKEMVANGEVSALTRERVWKEFSRALDQAAPSRFFSVLEACGAQAILFPMLKDSAVKHLHIAALANLQKFALLMHALQKKDLDQFYARYPVPKAHQALASLLQRFHQDYAACKKLGHEQLLTVFLRTDALRRYPRFLQWLACCEIIYPQHKDHSRYLLERLHAVQTLNIEALIKQELKGEEFAKALHDLRLKSLSAIKSSP